MIGQTRMSPLTAFFIGTFGVGAVTIACVSAIILFGMGIVDGHTRELVSFVDHTVGGTVKALPELLESLPPTIEDLLNDRRAPEYAKNIETKVNFIFDERSNSLRPAMTIVNRGEEVVSMLAVRVAALNAEGLPLREWTEVVATPIAIDDAWRGTLLPGATRHVVLSGRWRGFSPDQLNDISGAIEISELRVWQQSQELASTR